MVEVTQRKSHFWVLLKIIELSKLNQSKKKEPLKALFSSKWWGQIDKVRTFLLESVKDEDSFLRTLKIA